MNLEVFVQDLTKDLLAELAKLGKAHKDEAAELSKAILRLQADVISQGKAFLPQLEARRAALWAAGTALVGGSSREALELGLTILFRALLAALKAL